MNKMNKVILMSIQPKWLVKILNGEKTIEIRKMMPKCELPVDVYLYCTKDKPHLYFGDLTRQYETDTYKNKWGDELNGKVVAKFTLTQLDQIVYIGSAYRIGNNEARTNAVARKSCLDFKDLHTCLKGENGRAWHIDNLVIFDKPKELSEFMITNVKEGWTYYFKACEGFPPLPKETYIGLIDRGRAPIYCYKTLSKAPQGWQYAYIKGE